MKLINPSTHRSNKSFQNDICLLKKRKDWWDEGREEEEDAQNPITLIHKENADEEEKTCGGEKHQVRWKRPERNQGRGRGTDGWRAEREGAPPRLHRSERENLK